AEAVEEQVAQHELRLLVAALAVIVEFRELACEFERLAVILAVKLPAQVRKTRLRYHRFGRRSVGALRGLLLLGRQLRWRVGLLWRELKRLGLWAQPFDIGRRNFLLWNLYGRRRSTAHVARAECRVGNAGRLG